MGSVTIPEEHVGQLIAFALELGLSSVTVLSGPDAPRKVFHFGVESLEIVDPAEGGHDLCYLVQQSASASGLLALIRDVADNFRYVFIDKTVEGPPKLKAWWDAHFRHLASGFWESRINSLVVCIRPSPLGEFRGGVAKHVKGLAKFLPRFGVEVVDDVDEAEIVHTHAISVELFTDVYTNHGLYPLDEPISAAERRVNELAFRNFREARQSISVASWPTVWYSHILNVDPHVIPNWVDPDEWKDVPTGVFSGRRGVSPGFFLWSKGTTKGVCDPTPALSLAADMPAHTFVFTLTKPPVPPNVHEVGVLPFPEMQQALADCGVYVATSRENFAIQTLEAMLLEKPVLTLSHGGMSGNNDAVVHKVTGYVAEDQVDLMIGARYCLEHAERLGRAGRERVLEHYSWDKVVPEVVGVYREALHQRQDDVLRPKVSVVVPCYNLARFLPEALGSLREQTEQDFECIIVNDGSRDNFEAAVAPYLEDPRFTAVTQENQGVSVARNTGITRARGRFIMCLDADDKLRRDTLEKMSTALESSPEVFVVYPDFQLFGDGRGVIRMSPFSLKKLQRGNVVPYCAMWRRVLYDRGIALFKPMVYFEDYELWINIAKRTYPFERIPEPLLLYRKRRGQGLSATTKEGHPEALAQMRALHPSLWDPRVSVVIPTYNHAHYLRDGIGSVLKQIFQDFEIIVVDDGSDDSDDVLAAIGSFNDVRIRYIKHPRNRGLAAARNTGVTNSKGELILTLDADDKIKQLFLEKTVSFLDERKDIDIAYTDMELFGAVSRVLETPEYDFSKLVEKNLFACASLYRRAVFDDVGGYPTDMIYGWEDYAFWIAAGIKGHCGARIDEPLFMYRRDRESMIIQARPHIPEMREQLYSKFPEIYRQGRRPVGCCGRTLGTAFSRGRKQFVSHTAGPQVGEFPLAVVKYVGNKDTVTIKGVVTGTTYRFNQGHHQYVDPRDADRLDSRIFVPVTVSEVLV